MAAEGSKNRPPSENESGVALTTPTTRAGRGKRNCDCRACKSIDHDRLPCASKPTCIAARLPALPADQRPGSLDQPPRDGGNDFVRHAHLRTGRLAEHVTLIVDIVNHNKLTGSKLGNFAGEERHARQGGNLADHFGQGLEFEVTGLLRGDDAVLVGEAIPPDAPDGTKNVKDPKVSRRPVEFPGEDSSLKEVVLVF